MGSSPGMPPVVNDPFAGAIFCRISGHEVMARGAIELAFVIRMVGLLFVLGPEKDARNRCRR